MTYNIHDIFNTKGYFSIKVTPLGENLCLLEEREEQEEGEIKAMVDEGSDWLWQWFKEIRKWRVSYADKEMVTWLCCYSVP